MQFPKVWLWIRGARWLGCCLLLLVLCASAATAADHKPVRVLILGDSLSAAHNMAAESGWASLLEQRLKAHAGETAIVVNASISGETSSGGAARISALLAEHQPTIVIVELGANDSLRGLALKQTGQHLTDILRQARATGARTLLIGIDMPVNYGKRYRDGLRSLYEVLAASEADALLPNFLAPLAADPANFQEDRLHPTAAAQPELLAAVWSALQPLLP